MATVSNFEDLEIWQLARQQAIDIYHLYITEPFSKDWELKNQVNAASGSVMDNIAEGFERNGNREFIQFLSIAKGSVGEVKSQSYRAFDKKLISEAQHLKLNEMTEIEKNKIGAMMNYLHNCEIKGLKFK